MGRNTVGAAIAAPVTHRRSASLGSLGALGVVLALVLLGLTATSAFATTGHRYAGQFGSSGVGAGQFGPAGPNALSVRESTDDVFALDPVRFDAVGNWAPRIERFNATGDYQGSIQVDGSQVIAPNALAVDDGGTGSIYVGGLDPLTGGATGIVLKYSAAGVFQYTLNPALSSTTLPGQVVMAVDPVDGSLYVSALDGVGAPVIDKFSNTGAFVASFNGTANGGTAFSSVTSLAVDGSHRLYVTDAGKVQRYDATGAWQATIDDGASSRGAPGPIAADPTTDEIYAVEAGPVGQQVTRFSAGGAAPLETFGAGRITASGAIGVDGSSGTVYTADAGLVAVERFVAFTGPTVTTTAAAAIDPTSETLNGTIDPGGSPATFHFEYGLDPNYGASTVETDAGSGSGAVPATDTAVGLSPNTTYHVRLVGTNDSGTIPGNDVTFTTAPAPPIVDAGGGAPPNANPISPTGATLNAVVNPNGSATTFHFEYGTTTSYGSSTPDNTSLGQAPGDALASEAITGLTPNTVYHFRVVADNGTGGPQNGMDATFTTAPAAAAGATDVMGTTATLTGTVNPGGSAATYHFEYGTTTAYGKNTIETSAGSGTADKAVSIGVTGLEPGTLYHVRVVMSVNGIQVSSSDGTFTTDPAPTAITEPVDPASITSESATLHGSLDTHGLVGTYKFLVSSSSSAYASETAAQPLDAASGLRPVSAAIANLPDGEDYIVRLSVTSSGVTEPGDTVTFSTPKRPLAPPPPPSNTVANPYGCTAPVLAGYSGHPKPGDTIKIAGTDLGVGGTVMLGTTSVTPTSWTATGFSIVVPDNTTGTQALIINCGNVSNAIAIAMYQAPSNRFSAKGKVKGSTATLSVKVPGPGTIRVTGGSVKKATKHASKAGTSSVKVSLSSKGKKSVKRHKKLAVSLTVRFTPTGGTSASKTVTVTFKR